MSRTHKNDTFKLFQSEGDRQFIREHSPLLDRLSGVFDKATASVIDGRHVLAEPVYMTIDAKTVALSRKAPKQKQVLGAGNSVTLLLKARHPGLYGTPAIFTAFARRGDAHPFRPARLRYLPQRRRDHCWHAGDCPARVYHPDGSHRPLAGDGFPDALTGICRCAGPGWPGIARAPKFRAAGYLVPHVLSRTERPR